MRISKYKSVTFMARFKSVGKGVEVFAQAQILNPEVIELADGVRIDDYARIVGGKGIKIGKYVHFCSFSSIYGGGSAELGEYCGITQGVRFLTGTEGMAGVMTAAAPDEIRDASTGHTVMEPHGFIGANAVIMPNIIIGRGAVVGAGAVVTRNVGPWDIVGGVPARVIGKRTPLEL